MSEESGATDDTTTNQEFLKDCPSSHNFDEDACEKEKNNILPEGMLDTIKTNELTGTNEVNCVENSNEKEENLMEVYEVVEETTENECKADKSLEKVNPCEHENISGNDLGTEPNDDHLPEEFLLEEMNVVDAWEEEEEESTVNRNVKHGDSKTPSLKSSRRESFSRDSRKKESQRQSRSYDRRERDRRLSRERSRRKRSCNSERERNPRDERVKSEKCDFKTREYGKGKDRNKIEFERKDRGTNRKVDEIKEDTISREDNLSAKRSSSLKANSDSLTSKRFSPSRKKSKHFDSREKEIGEKKKYDYPHTDQPFKKTEVSTLSAGVEDDIVPPGTEDEYLPRSVKIRDQVCKTVPERSVSSNRNYDDRYKSKKTSKDQTYRKDYQRHSSQRRSHSREWVEESRNVRSDRPRRSSRNSRVQRSNSLDSLSSLSLSGDKGKFETVSSISLTPSPPHPEPSRKKRQTFLQELEQRFAEEKRYAERNRRKGIPSYHSKQGILQPASNYVDRNLPYVAPPYSVCPPQTNIQNTPVHPNFPPPNPDRYYQSNMNIPPPSVQQQASNVQSGNEYNSFSSNYPPVPPPTNERDSFQFNVPPPPIRSTRSESNVIVITPEAPPPPVISEADMKISMGKGEYFKVGGKHLDIEALLHRCYKAIKEVNVDDFRNLKGRFIAFGYSNDNEQLYNPEEPTGEDENVVTSSLLKIPPVKFSFTSIPTNITGAESPKKSSNKGSGLQQKCVCCEERKKKVFVDTAIQVSPSDVSIGIQVDLTLHQNKSSMNQPKSILKNSASYTVGPNSFTYTSAKTQGYVGDNNKQSGLSGNVGSFKTGDLREDMSMNYGLPATFNRSQGQVHQSVNSDNSSVMTNLYIGESNTYPMQQESFGGTNFPVDDTVGRPAYPNRSDYGTGSSVYSSSTGDIWRSQGPTNPSLPSPFSVMTKAAMIRLEAERRNQNFASFLRR